jgi:glycosyltransferase involved in cell wall biosynthesis
MTRLAIVTTHPIQYYAPVFKMLTSQFNLEVKVFYTWGKESLKKYDPGFGKEIEWDIPLLEGYEYIFLKNTSSDAGSHHFKGIINPDAIKDLEKFAPDALLLYGWAYQSHLKILRHFHKNVPVYFRGDSNLTDVQRGLKDFIRTFFLKWLYKHIDYAFYVGTANKAYYKKAGLKEEQLLFAPHAIDNYRFSEDKKAEAGYLRSSLFIKEDDTLILFAGKMEEKKAPEVLLNAYGKLNCKKLHLLFTGNGPMESQLKEAANGWANIHFIDFRNQKELPAIYQACDLFCLPSRGPGETWGLAVNEAMASGKAVLVSDKVGCATDLVKEGENGYIFESGNEDDLFKKLGVLVADKERLSTMGKKSFETIQDWSFKKQVISIAEAINKKQK